MPDTTTVASLKEHRDWRPNNLPDGTIYVGRACYRGGWRLPEHPLRNPYSTKHYSLYDSLSLYVEWVFADPERTALAKSLQGLTLACHCKTGTPCHTRIIAAIADNQPDRIPAILKAARRDPPR